MGFDQSDQIDMIKQNPLSQYNDVCHRDPDHGKSDLKRYQNVIGNDLTDSYTLDYR